MKKAILLTLLAAIILSTRTWAQPTGIVTDATCTIPGLHYNNASSFIIDNSGNKWVGFDSPASVVPPNPQLLRYNGTQWDTFPHIPGKKINVLAVDAANNIWIGGNQGLTKFDGTSYTTYNTGTSSIISDTIISLAYGNGNVYIGTYRGLSVFNGTSFTNYNRSNGMACDSVYCITVENATTIWLGNQYGMDKFSGSSFSFKTIHDRVNCIYVDDLHRKWVGTYATGNAWRYNDTTFTFIFDLLGGYAHLKELFCGDYSYIPCSSFCNKKAFICKGPKGGVYIENVQCLPSFAPFKSVEFFDNNRFVFWNDASAFLQYDYTSHKMYGINDGVYSVVLNHIDTTLYGGASRSPCDSVGTWSDFSVAATLLDINNVIAVVLDNSDGNWLYGSAVPGYNVPKQNGTSPLFASSFWIGGYSNNNLHMGAMTYRQNGYDFWPGPLDTTNATADTITAVAYNQLWKVNRFDIANFMYNWAAGNVQSGLFTPAPSILHWPGNGSGNYAHNMAPYVDVNHNNLYDPLAGGDYPLIKGDQMVWWVFNDNFTNHTETGGLPMGIEVHASAYAFTCPGITDSNAVLNNTVFYNYQIFNRSANLYDSCHVMAWVDSDLGYYLDDYVGCNVMGNFGYTYNAENYDPDYANAPGYHKQLPAFSCNILNGPYANPHDGIDNNNNGVIDEPNEKCLMGSMLYYNNTGSPMNGNPSSAKTYYNLTKGVWETGYPMTFGDLGLDSISTTHPKTKFMFPGTSDPYGIALGGSIASPVPTPSVNWSEYTTPGDAFGDRRFLPGIGPFSMQPHSVYEVDWAFVFSQDTINCVGNNLCILPRMVQDNNRVRNWFNNNNFPSCLNLNSVGIKQYQNPMLECKLYPNPTNGNLYLAFANPQKNTTIEVYDMLGNIINGFQYNEESSTFIIPTSALASGLYVLKVRSQNGYSVQKFIKE
ncbi:MAG: T9SS type A sorting domain-containing protein [Bacteroidetes bacterium]|nr:T9SS type A sorting domain-containing protein [Bacteroidota bacterium]